MTQQKNLAGPFSHFSKTPTLIGGAIGLTVISFFLLITNDPRPEWGRFWMVRPLIITPAAGFLGGALFSIIAGIRIQNNVAKLAAYVAGVILFLFVLWIGTILGLDGTLWD